MIEIPTNLVPVELMTPAADAAGRTGDYISLKHAIRAWIEVHLDQGNAATVALTPYQATNVSAGSEKVLANAVPIYANQDLAAASGYTRQTDAVNFTTSAAVKHKSVIFVIDPAQLDVEGGFDCITLKTGASNAANITSARVWVQSRYAGTTQPSFITD